MTFDKELETYRQELSRLLAVGHRGQFVVIRGDSVLGFRADLEEAMTRGRELCGEDLFLVKEVGESRTPIRC